jgi:hypothetical protein
MSTFKLNRTRWQSFEFVGSSKKGSKTEEACCGKISPGLYPGARTITDIREFLRPHSVTPELLQLLNFFFMVTTYG